MKKVLFMDHDGILAVEPPMDYQLGPLEELELYSKIMCNLDLVCNKLDSEFVMVTDQDGLDTAFFPEETSWLMYNLMMKISEGEGVTFNDICIDRSMPEDNMPTCRPRAGMLTKYLGNSDYDLVNSLVVGDHTTGVELAKNLGCRATFLQEDTNILKPKFVGGEAVCEGLEDICALATKDWGKIAEFLPADERETEVRRITRGTNTYVAVSLGGNSRRDIHIGLGSFDHMLEQIGKCGGMDLTIHVKGDLGVDKHHTIEDTALALGDCLYRALGNKRGIECYSCALPMNDCLCQVYLGFGGRSWLVWDAEFRREKIGEMSTEMFLHLFKLLSDVAKMSPNIKAEGQNKHRKVEGISKALMRASKMVARRDTYHYELSSSEGVLQLPYLFTARK